MMLMFPKQYQEASALHSLSNQMLRNWEVSFIYLFTFMYRFRLTFLIASLLNNTAG